jgi:steroid delta-isomerase-like uncharacterized protein
MGLRLATVCLALVVAACGNTNGTAPKPSLTPDQAAKTFFTEVLNRHNVAAMDSLVSSSVVDHDPVSGQPPGLAGFRQRYAALFTAFPDLVATPDDVITQGEKAAVQDTIKGTQTGPFLGAPPTGKPVALSGTDVFRVVDGKITEHWGRQDDASVRAQLGLAP